MSHVQEVLESAKKKLNTVKTIGIFGLLNAMLPSLVRPKMNLMKKRLRHLLKMSVFTER